MPDQTSTVHARVRARVLCLTLLNTSFVVNLPLPLCLSPFPHPPILFDSSFPKCKSQTHWFVFNKRYTTREVSVLKPMARQNLTGLKKNGHLMFCRFEFLYQQYCSFCCVMGQDQCIHRQSSRNSREMREHKSCLFWVKEPLIKILKTFRLCLFNANPLRKRWFRKYPNPCRGFACNPFQATCFKVKNQNSECVTPNQHGN